MPRAWIVGGSRGLGRGSAEALAAAGYDLVVSSRPGKRLTGAVAELQEAWPDRAINEVPLDLSDEASVAAAADSVIGDLPDAVVISSGGPPPAQASTLQLDALDAAYRSLLRPVAQIIAALAAPMIHRGSGVFVIVTSSGVREPIPGLATSNIVRAGVTALMKSAAAELAPHGVRVLAVAPGRIDTERVSELDSAAATRSGSAVEDVRGASITTIPAGRYGSAAEFGAVVAFACSDAASYVTGTTISVDGGKSRGLLG